ncbi:uncharacterized protein O3C94_015959 isoform 2-T3 [Discoglossus pictus]
MMELKSTLVCLLVASLQLQICISAPVNEVTAHQAPPSNTNNGAIAVSNNGIKVTAPPLPTGRPNAPVFNVGHMVTVPTPRPGGVSTRPSISTVGHETAVKGTGPTVTTRPVSTSIHTVPVSKGVSPALATGASTIRSIAAATSVSGTASKPISASTNPATRALGSTSSNHVPSTNPLVTMKPDNFPVNTANVAHGVPSVTASNANIFPMRHTIPISSVPMPNLHTAVNTGVENIQGFNICPDQCPNGTGGNPPCICVDFDAIIKGSEPLNEDD